MTEVGRMLEEARLRKGITLDKVENDLKIRKHYLLAIEAGHWDQLPGYAYATGFLRSYGDYLGLSGEDLVEEYKYWRKAQGIDTIAEDVPVGVFTRAKELQTDTGIFQLGAKDHVRASRRRKIHRGLVVTLILVVALAAYLFLTWRQPFSDTGDEPTPSEEVHMGYDRLDDTGAMSREEPLMEAPESILDETSLDGAPAKKTPVAERAQGLSTETDEAANLDFDDATDVESEKSEIEEEAREVGEVDDTVLPDDYTADLDVEVTLPSDAIHRLPPVEVGEEVWPVTLEATTTGRCWVEVRSDGRLIASRTLEAGEHHTWRALEELKVRFGNAGVVELKLNGKDLGLAGKGVTTRVFTADFNSQD